MNDRNLFVALAAVLVYITLLPTGASTAMLGLAGFSAGVWLRRRS